MDLIKLLETVKSLSLNEEVTKKLSELENKYKTGSVTEEQAITSMKTELNTYLESTSGKPFWITNSLHIIEKYEENA